MAVGDAPARRVCHAFEDAGNGCGIEREGDKNGSVREGELADVRWRCRKKQHISQWRIEWWRQCNKI